MMQDPLLVINMLRRASSLFPEKQVVSVDSNGATRAFGYGDLYGRTCRLAGALRKLGVERGDSVGTLAWNTHRHLEAYFAVPGMGAVLHTLNGRLSRQDLVYIINDARDRIVLVDEEFAALIFELVPELPTVEYVVIMSDDVSMGKRFPDALSYEALLNEAAADFSWPMNLDEGSASAICHTSATTGRPKGVVYTHRSQTLHTMCLGLADTLAVSERDIVLPYVPMFHANGWGLPYAAVWFGATLVLPGPRPDYQRLEDLLVSRSVTLAAGATTVWIACLPRLTDRVADLSDLRAIVSGGSAMAPAVLQGYESLGIQVLHGFGMTEASPTAFICRIKSYMHEWNPPDRRAIMQTQGLLVPGLEMRVVSADDKDVARDGHTAGELLLRGPWIASNYIHRDSTDEEFRQGWFHTGDIVTWDANGYISVVDREKDIIKSGGEWISSVQLENAIMSVAGVAEAAVVGAPHSIWQERPLACVVRTKIGSEVPTKVTILEHLRPLFAKWWLPDDIVFLDELPKTGVGKVHKQELRERFMDYLA